jgi:hypothetical protein
MDKETCFLSFFKISIAAENRRCFRDDPTSSYIPLPVRVSIDTGFQFDGLRATTTTDLELPDQMLNIEVDWHRMARESRNIDEHVITHYIPAYVASACPYIGHILR